MEVSGGDGVGGGGGGGGGDGDGEGGSETLDTSTSSNNRAHKMSISHMIHFDERWYTILAQVIIPFLIAGLGMVGAGVVLDIVQHWELYKAITAIFTLIPALLGLKGNLEMTLAARFSTQVYFAFFRTTNLISFLLLRDDLITIFRY
jgi:solute carrier family 41